MKQYPCIKMYKFYNDFWNQIVQFARAFNGIMLLQKQ